MTNPLSQYFRATAIYLKLPSQGKFWDENSINLPFNYEIPVMPMTAMDDLNLKTPDALFNGIGVVNLIQSCCPNILDAWNTPSIDLDAILIGIRIASYGEKMEFESRCPKCAEDNVYDMNLTSVLDNIKSPDFSIPVTDNQLKIFLKPQNYKQICQAGLMAYEEQQTLKLLADSEIQESDKQRLFNEQLQKIHKLTIDTVTNSTDYIETAEGIRVHHRDHIEEFYSNVGNNLIQKVKSKLEDLAKNQTIEPINVTCSNCSNKFTTSFEFDYSSFFVSGS